MHYSKLMLTTFNLRNVFETVNNFRFACEMNKMCILKTKNNEV